MTRGQLVVLEGIDRAGKSSALKLLPDLLTDIGVEVTHTGELQSPLGPIIRQNLMTLSPMLKAYLFAADRAWTFERAAEPALASGGLVVWDRYVASALVYRSVEASVSDVGLLQLTLDINRPFPRADLTLLVEVSIETSIARGQPEGLGPYDADFLRKVQAEYRRRASDEGWVPVDGEGAPSVVAQEAADAIRKMLRESGAR